MLDQFFVQQRQGICSFKFHASFISMTKLQAINGDRQTNQLKSELYLKASLADFKWHTHQLNIWL